MGEEEYNVSTRRVKKGNGCHGCFFDEEHEDGYKLRYCPHACGAYYGDEGDLVCEVIFNVTGESIIFVENK